MNIEVERKFLINETPRDMLQCPHKEILQGYLVIEDHYEVRLRKKGKLFFQTVKRGKGLKREEVEIELTPEQFARLWPLTESRRLEKTRYEINEKDVLIEVDVYAKALNKLVTAEVEFKTVEESFAFVPPGWFGAEITEDERFKNKNLSINGMPE